MNHLPNGWELLPLKDCVFFQEGPGLRKWQFGESGVPFLNIRTFNNGTIDKTKCQFVKLADFTGKYEHFLLEEGDIVVSSSGTLGKLVVVRKQDLPLMLNTSVIRYRSLYPQHLLQAFLKLFLQSHHFFTQIQSAKTGSAILNYGPSHIKEMEIIVPPLNEQRRIVAKFEKLLSRVDAARARLATIPRILKRFRQSVLAAACSGRLTTDWRETHTAGLASFGEVSDDLPESWRKCPLSEVARISSGEAFKKSEYSQAGARLLQIANVSFGEIIWEQQNFLPRSYLKSHSDLVLTEGDILMALNRPLLNGRIKVARLTKDDVPAILYQRVGRFSLVGGKKINPSFLFLFLQSFGFIQELSERLRGSDQPYINPPDMLEIIFPLPPFIEQQEIVRRVEALLKTADALEARYRTAKAHVDKLTQSILATAFRGELVPQDPNDEPASVLLERIRKERNGAEPKKKGHRK